MGIDTFGLKDIISTVGLNTAFVQKYIQEQEKHDIALDKLSVKEYEDSFKGSSSTNTTLVEAKHTEWMGVHGKRLESKLEAYSLRANHPFEEWL